MGICMQHANSATPAATPACSLPIRMASGSARAVAHSLKTPPVRTDSTRKTNVGFTTDE